MLPPPTPHLCSMPLGVVPVMCVCVLECVWTGMYLHVIRVLLFIFRSLEDLNLSLNQISELSGWGLRFPKLQILNVCDNMISAWKQVVGVYFGSSNYSLSISAWKHVVGAYFGSSNYSLSILAWKHVVGAYFGYCNYSLSISAWKQVVGVYFGSSNYSLSISAWKHVVGAYFGYCNYSLRKLGQCSIWCKAF